MKRTLNMVVNYIFKNTYFIRVEATVNPNNVNSYRLLESCSFLREGLLRSYSYSERTGEIENRLMYSKVKGVKNNV